MAETNETEYLRESLRLVELRLEQQKFAYAVQQRKAALLITFCAAAIGYLYAGRGDEFSETHALWSAGDAVLALALAAAIFYSIKVLDVGQWEFQGANTGYVLHKSFARDFNKLAGQLLESYDANFSHNKNTLRVKGEQLKKARNWGVRGMAALFVWLTLKTKLAGALLLF